jgi:hypothetical protein
MPTSVPLTTKNPGDVLTSTLWNTQLKQNIDKLLATGHRVLTVAQFGALTGLEGTKGTVAPDEVYLEVDSANGIQWHLAYESGETTYKWRFLGGPAMYSEVAASEGTSSTTYAALATAGPSIALPRGGDFDVQTSMYTGPDAASRETDMSYDIGGTGAVDADAITTFAGTGGPFLAAICRTRRKTALGAVTLTAKYKVTAGTGTFVRRTMLVTPVRLI